METRVYETITGGAYQPQTVTSAPMTTTTTATTTATTYNSGRPEGANRVAAIIVGAFVIMTVSIMLFIPVIEYLRTNGCPRSLLCWRCDQGCCSCCSRAYWLHPSACFDPAAGCLFCAGCRCEWSSCADRCVHWASGRACCEMYRKHRDRDGDYV